MLLVVLDSEPARRSVSRMMQQVTRYSVTMSSGRAMVSALLPLPLPMPQCRRTQRISTAIGVEDDAIGDPILGDDELEARNGVGLAAAAAPNASV
jgi:hypothetical protein